MLRLILLILFSTFIYVKDISFLIVYVFPKIISITPLKKCYILLHANEKLNGVIVEVYITTSGTKKSAFKSLGI